MELLFPADGLCLQPSVRTTPLELHAVLRSLLFSKYLVALLSYHSPSEIQGMGH